MKKKALVTSDGFGVRAKEVTEQLFAHGYEIIVVNEEKYIHENKLEVISYEQADFNSKDSINQLIDRLKHHKFNAIVNCHDTLAFVGDRLRHDFYDFDYIDFAKVINYNVVSIAAICIGLKDNIETGGCIINITSSAAKEGGFVTIAYNASKAAVENMSKSLANNFGLYNGIRVNCVAPGWIPKSAGVAAVGTRALADSLTPVIPNGQNKDLAKAVIEIINNNSINGSIIVVDGGISSSYLPYMLESLLEKGDESVDSVMNTLTELIKKENEKNKIKIEK
jgi:NAD(P)-dependent dehydrogenase (short-subunit alcohol dehydrogenase family)